MLRSTLTPPCGVPSDVGNNCFLSITPALSHPRTCRRMVGDVFNFLSSASWSMRSKHLEMSASSTNFGLHLILRNIASIASWHERPGLNPYELGSNRASHSGSKASLTSACKARSYIVGILRMRLVPSFLGMGIFLSLLWFQVWAFCLSNTSSSNLSLKFREALPSTPAVFLPLFSWVTWRIASNLALRDFSISFWRLLALFRSPSWLVESASSLVGVLIRLGS